MDFSIPETHTEIKNLATDIFTDYSTPERLKGLETNGTYFDKEVWNKLVETSLHAASLSESLGGMGLDYSATAMITEAIGRSMVSIPYIPCIISTALPLQPYYSNETVHSALQSVVNGDGIITTAFIESGNENTLKPKTTVSQSGKNFLLNGSKQCVPYAKDANWILLTAMNDGELWAGLVNPKSEGLELTEQIATSNEPQYQLTFTDTPAVIVAQGIDATLLIESSLAMTTAAICNMAAGISDKMTRIAGEYTSQREQFGVPIATFQAVAHRLADAYIDTECLKIITLKATNDVNQADYDNESIAMAKVWCGDVLHRVSQASQHVHGGTGIDKDYHLFRYCLWAKQLELSLGNSKVHLANIADQLEQHYLEKIV